MSNKGNLFSFETLYKKATQKMEFDFRSLQQFCNSCSPGPIADFGAGFGRLLAADLNRDLILIEKNDEMRSFLDAACKKQSKVKVLHQDAFMTTLPNNSISGALFAHATLAEMRPSLFALHEAYRVLKDDGKLYILLLNPECPQKSAVGMRLAVDETPPFTYVINTLSVPSFGKFEYQTHFTARGDGRECSRIFRQTFPPASKLVSTLETLGFTDCFLRDAATGGEFEPVTSRLYECVATKGAAGDQSVFQPELKQFYDQVADKYDDVVDTGKYGVDNWLGNCLEGFVDTYPRVLDLGCANGHIGKIFKASGCNGQMFGIDFSAQMISEARSNGLYSGLLEWDLANSFPLFEEMEFDIITAFGITEFVSDISSFLRSAYLSLEIGGQIWMTFEKTIDSSVPFGKPIEKHGFRKYHYTEETVKNLVTDANFHITSIEESHGYHSPNLNVNVPYLYVKAKRVAQ